MDTLSKLYRHGDRTPIELYPADPNPESVWKLGLGKLTLLGMKQQYALGKYFRSMYDNFITTNPLEINVTSGDEDRCMRSAETNLASFYAPTPEWRFEKDVPWQPIPVYYIPQIQDKYLEEDSYCPRADEEVERLIVAPDAQPFIQEHLEMFENLTKLSGKLITEYKSASYFYNAVSIEEKYNLTVPSWVLPWWDELKNVSERSFYWRFRSQLIQRLRVGPLIQLIIEKMNSKISGALPDQKIQIYSGHDVNIAMLLNVFKLFNMKIPPYCSSLIFELYERNGTHALRLLFLNSTEPEEKIDPPHVLVLDGCSEFCPLQFFVDYTKDLIPEDWDKECASQRTVKEAISVKNVGLATLFALMAIVILALFIFTLWKFHIIDRKYSYDRIC